MTAEHRWSYNGDYCLVCREADGSKPCVTPEQPDPYWLPDGDSDEQPTQVGECCRSNHPELHDPDCGAQPVEQEGVPELEQVVMFLLGEDEIGSHWFHERPEGKGPYWWRIHLRDAWNRHEARRLASGQGDVERLARRVMAIMGPKPAPCCDGCSVEWNMVLDLVRPFAKQQEAR